jgi:hypothetical protein
MSADRVDKRWDRQGRVFGLVVATLVLAAARPAAAQQRPYLVITGLRGSLSVNGQGDFETVDPPGQSSRKLRSLIFDERAGLTTRGYFYDPGLIYFILGGEFGWVQDQSDVDGMSRSGDGDLYGYNLHASFLRDRPYSLDAFALRTTTTLSRDFAGTSRTTSELFGATGHLRDLPVPLTIDVRQEEVDQRFTLSPFVSRSDERRRIARLSGAREWQTQTLDLAYEFNRREDLVNGRASFDLQQADVRHRLYFGRDLQDSLFSSVRVLDVQGNFDTRSILANESLRLFHGHGLSSQYSYLFADLDVSSGTTRTHTGSATLTHQLYQSLTTNVGAQGSTSSLTDGSISSYGPFFDVAYRKLIPWDGTVTAGTGVTYLLQDQDVPGGIVSAFQERHAFSDATPFFLDSTGVALDTIVVTDTTATILFDEGSDYVVREIGNRVQIERNPLGRIPAAATVLVSYDFEVPPKLRYSNLSTHYDLALDFPWAGVFYSRSHVDATVLEGENVGDFIEDVRDDRAGFELRVPANRRLTASARQAYEDYRSARLTYTSYELNQLVSYAVTERIILSLTGGESFFDFSEPSRTTDVYVARMIATWRPLAGILVEGFAGIHARNDSLATDTRFIEGGLRSRVRVGRFDLAAGYTHEARTIGETDSMGDSFHFSVTRWFGR